MFLFVNCLQAAVFPRRDGGTADIVQHIPVRRVQGLLQGPYRQRRPARARPVIKVQHHVITLQYRQLQFLASLTDINDSIGTPSTILLTAGFIFVQHLRGF